MKKDISRSLNLIAKELPLCFNSSVEYHVMTGEELLVETEFPPKGIEPEKKYKVPMPVMIAINHHSKLKKLYKIGKMEAVKSYCVGVLNSNL